MLSRISAILNQHLLLRVAAKKIQVNKTVQNTSKVSTYSSATEPFLLLHVNPSTCCILQAME